MNNQYGLGCLIQYLLEEGHSLQEAFLLYTENIERK